MLEAGEILTQGITGGVVPHLFQEYQRRQARRELMEDRIFESRNDLQKAGREDFKNDEKGVIWIRRFLAMSFLISFFILTYTLLFSPSLVTGLEKKYNKIFGLGGSYSLIHLFVHAHLVFCTSIFIYYLGGLSHRMRR